MTISYSENFGQLLFRWKGSLWKTLYLDVAIFLLLYYLISFLYRLILIPGFAGASAMALFERTAMSCHEVAREFPLQFLLGFYVALALRRWWLQVENIPYPDNFMYWLCASIRGNNNESVSLRLRVARYVLLSTVMALRDLSTRVRKRFPTMEHIEAAALITANERKLLEETTLRVMPNGPHFVPLNWIASTLLQINIETERRDITVCSKSDLKQLLKELQEYRNKIEKLFIIDWITIPLAYTQLVTICTYAYFALCLLGSQYLPPMAGAKEFRIDMYFPLFAVLQLVFYVGWLKVAEEISNPFGSKDEDFETNYLLDRHLEMLFAINNLHGQMPPAEQSGAQEAFLQSARGLNHTRASMRSPDRRPRNHVLRQLSVNSSECQIVSHTRLQQEQYLNAELVANSNIIGAKPRAPLSCQSSPEMPLKGRGLKMTRNLTDLKWSLGIRPSSVRDMNANHSNSTL